MASDNCPICKDLSERAVSAIANHVRLVGKLEIAEIQLDYASMDNLRPLIEDATVQRKRAVDEFRSHRGIHGDLDAEGVGS